MSFAGVHHVLVVLAEAFRALLVCRAVESAKRLPEGGVGELGQVLAHLQMQG